jgi:mevalonate pyrophosphate decarboxylase
MKEIQTIGISVVNHFFDYYKRVFMDDETEFFPVLKTIINGVVNACKENKKEIQNELEQHAKKLYCDLWLSHAKEDEENVDIISEKEDAIETFNKIYKNL